VEQQPVRRIAGGRAAVSKGAAVALRVGALAGCGAANDPDPTPTPPPSQDQARAAKVKRATTDGAVRDAVMRSYTSTDVADCGRVYTTAFIRDAFKGIAGCQKHVRELAKLPKRTIRIISVHRSGPVADAKVRVDNFDSTVKLVLTGTQWQVDDTVSATGSARTNLAQARSDARKLAKNTKAVPLGQGVAFKPLAGAGPNVTFTAAVVQVVDHGVSRNGTREATGPIYDDFGKVTNPAVRYRIVNVRVKLTVAGPKPFKGSLSGVLIGRNGHHWEVAQHMGRTPDWTDGERRGIAPGHSVTRWMTFPLPAVTPVRSIELSPNVLSGPNTVSIVEPQSARWLPK
jgi:hypothetical protein